MKEKELSYKNIIYYEIESNDSKMYSLDKKTLYNSKEEVKHVIDNANISN